MGMTTTFAPYANEAAARYAIAAADLTGWWEQQAARLHWDTPWHTALEWNPPQPLRRGDWDGPLSIPEAKWFVGGQLNAAVNCVDRHVAGGRGDQVAYYFEGEPGDRRTLTYQQLQDEVARAANAFTVLGITAGDRVILYLPASWKPSLPRWLWHESEPCTHWCSAGFLKRRCAFVSLTPKPRP